MAASSENDSGAGSMASTQSAGVSPALEMLLNSKFEDLSTQFGFFEGRLDAIDKKLSVLDKVEKKVAKLETLEQSLVKEQKNQGRGLECMVSNQTEAGKAINNMAGAVDAVQHRLTESKNNLATIEKRLSVLDSLDQKLGKLEKKVSTPAFGVEQKLAALRGKANAAAANEEDLDRPTLDSKLDAMAERIQGIEEGINTISSSASTGPATTEAVVAALDEKLRDVTPKISTMHSNLEVLLTGESEASGLIDKVHDQYQITSLRIKTN